MEKDKDFNLIDDLANSIKNQTQVVEALDNNGEEAVKASEVLCNLASSYEKVQNVELKKEESKKSFWTTVAQLVTGIVIPGLGFLFMHHENQVARRWESDGNYVASQTSKQQQSMNQSLLKDLFRPKR